MYYDRTIHERLARSIGSGEPLSWLMEHMRSSEGRELYAHVQFRRDRHARRHGGIQLYWGRTSPLEFRLRGDGRVKPHADATYRRLSEGLFSEPVAIDRLGARQDDFRAHLERASRLLANSSPRLRAFVSGEARCHAGLMRRYGHYWQPTDPLVAIDSEARIGYRDSVQRDADDAETRKQLRLAAAEQIPRKLDTLGVLPSGDVAIVEVKDANGSICRAIIQAAAHLVRYSRLAEGGGLMDPFRRMIDQKTAKGLIPAGAPRPSETPRFVPCIAAPDRSADWPAGWKRAFDQCAQEVQAELADLVFIRLDGCGRILDFLPRSRRLHGFL